MQKKIETEKIAYSIKEASKATGLSPATIYKLFNDGRLQRRKVGRRTFILADDIVQFFQSCKSEQSSGTHTSGSAEKDATVCSSSDEGACP